MSRLLTTGAVMLALVFTVTSIRAEEPKPDDSSFWMKRKLELSQKVFAALAEGDFDTIDESARTMAKLNTIERFIRGRNPEYRAQLEIFRFANSELIRQAEKKNIDGAALAFHQLTLSCVNCHKQIRAEKEGK
jgi:cytochrome c556